MDNNQNKDLRIQDFVTSIVLFIFGLFIIIGAAQMPVSSSYGGVKNVWYVSPALFPFIIGGSMLVLSILLGFVAVKEVGMESIIKRVGHFGDDGLMGTFLKERNLRYIAILSFFVFYVYLFIPRIDYFLATFNFLLVFMSIFYFNDYSLLKKLYKFYLIGSLLFLAYFILNIDQLFGRVPYFADYLFMVFIASYYFYTRAIISGHELKHKFKVSFIMSLIVPLAIVPLFKYFLLVILPYEGIVIKLMNFIAYDIFGL